MSVHFVFWTIVAIALVCAVIGYVKKRPSWGRACALDPAHREQVPYRSVV